MNATLVRAAWRPLLLLCSLASASLPLFAQGAKTQSAYEAIAEEDADHPVQRDLWFFHGRVIRGSSGAGLRYRANLQKMQMRAARIAAARQSTQPLTSSSSGWTPLGPAPLASNATGSLAQQDYGWVSGRATAVVIDPADNTGNTLYVGGAYGGLWRSQNATSGGYGNPSGVSWTPLIDNQATLAVGAIAIQPGNVTGQLSNVILVGTGEANSAGDSYFGLGILRSADAGNTWNLISTANSGSLSFAGLAAARMAFGTKSGQTNTVVAAMATSSVGALDGLITSSTQRGLYTSIDAGQSWLFNPLVDPGNLQVTPATSATAVAYNATAGLFFAAIRYHGVYSSPDGLNWTRLANQPGGGILSATACPANYLSAPTPCPIYRGEIAVVPGRNEMYVWLVDVHGNDKGIWRSTNSGGSWTQIPDTSITNCGDPAGGCGTAQGTYNLEISAVPNGTTATDVYAGAINLYKCTLATNTSTNCSQGAWLNLTHVYGCSAIAKVHPDQHALDFMAPVNGKDVMYFANDGGVYRALDGYLGLSTATCGQTNQFDSLNQTLGSMTQFVSFSQHPSDRNTLLGGTQDNGSPATASATTSTTWLNVNGGDGGYNAINPSNPTEWFTANTDVSIQRCTSGIACLENNFALGTIATPTTLLGDHGAFYTPYILDPQVIASELLIGTCRVWRGAGVGGSFTPLSLDFEPNAVPPCTGAEVNLVRSLAAGGAKDLAGFSNVIYAGTDGYGATTTPLGGRIWVTTNAASGAWTDSTGNINPGSFPISGIAIDTADPSGSTAYVTIMGFHVSHVWKTTSAGVTWSDFSGMGLPDSPANAVVIDPGTTTSNGMVYLATDVGVFSSSTGGAVWTEVGPAPGSGSAGYLPNVPVTALRIFNSGGNKRLRASTYGRGIWDFNLVVVPDFQIAVSNSTQTIFPTQSAIYNGSLTALNGYNSSVALSCTGTKPASCVPNPAGLTPTTSGAAFTVTAAGVPGDYAFNAHAVGSDPNVTTHDAALTLHVVDFALTAPSPGSVSVNRPDASPPVSFSVTAAGSFSSTVTLSCSGLPSGAACNFSPSASVNPTSSSPVAVTLTISTSNTTPTGSSTVTISAGAAGAPAPKTQALSLTVTALPDYVLAITPPTPVTANQTVQFTGTLTSINSYASPVNLSCSGNAPSTCIISPSSVTPTAAGALFTVTVGSATAGTFNFNIAGTGTDSSHISHSVPATLTVNSDFTITNSSGVQTVLAGQTAIYSLVLAPVGSSTFGSAVTLSCLGAPNPPNQCTMNPSSIPGTSGAITVTVSIATLGPNSARRRTQLLPLLGIPIFGMILATIQRPKRRYAALGVAITLTLLFIACGGGGASSISPPPSVITVRVTPASANVFPGQTQQFTATVTGTTNPQVNWSANGAGSISNTGLYTPPATVTTPSTVTVSAQSQADTTKAGTATVNLEAPTANGSYSITINANLNGVQHYTILTLNVQ